MIRVVDGRLDLEQFERVITMAYWQRLLRESSRMNIGSVNTRFNNRNVIGSIG